MTDEAQIARFLDLLIQQTGYGNVTWTEQVEGNSYAYALNESLVQLEARDNDGYLPYVFTVFNGGRSVHRWVCYGPDVSRGDPDDTPDDPAPEWIAERVRRLWEVLRQLFVTDPIAELLKDLEDMPPF